VTPYLFYNEGFTNFPALRRCYRVTKCVAKRSRYPGNTGASRISKRSWPGSVEEQNITQKSGKSGHLYKNPLSGVKVIFLL
jgi:hypothetical protein